MERFCQTVRHTFGHVYYDIMFKDMFPGMCQETTVLSAEDANYLLAKIGRGGNDVISFMSILHQIQEDIRNEKLCVAIAGLSLGTSVAITAPPVGDSTKPSADRTSTAEDNKAKIIAFCSNTKHTIGPMCPHLAAHGRLDLLQAALSLGWKIHRDSFIAAAKHNQLEVLEWLRKTVPLEWCPNKIFTTAAEHLSFDVLNAVYDAEVWQEVGIDVYTTAATNGRLEIIQWVVVQKLACGAKLIAELAAKNGHDHIVKWMKNMSVDI